MKIRKLTELEPLNMMSLNVIHRFGIANTFAPGEETTFTKIAQATGLSEGVVKQIIRHSVTLRVFHEPRKGVITHTARSVLMRDSRRANHLSWGIDEVVPAGLRVDTFPKYVLSKGKIRGTDDNRFQTRLRNGRSQRSSMRRWEFSSVTLRQFY